MTTTGTMPLSTWGESVARHLLDDSSCPICQWTLSGGTCARCGADLRGPISGDVWKASQSAAAAMRARDELLRQVPVLSLAPVGAMPRPAEDAPTPVAATEPSPASAPDPQSSATLQSVLATAGAGLFAVAAIVFTYFNPDLADRALRGVIVGLVTLLFLGGAWMLSRRSLRFSAEAVGGLGLVFAGLDIHAFAQLAAPAVDPWFTAAAVTAAAGAVMLLAGRRRGIRIWEWTAVTALALTPAMLGVAGGTPLSAVLGAIGVAAAGAALIEWVRPPLVEQITLTAVQLIASLSALVLMWRVDAGSDTAFFLTISGVLLLVAVHAVIAARRMLAGLWAYGAGGTGAAAVVVAVFALTGEALQSTPWLFAIVPAAASVALVLIGALVPLPRAVPRGLVAAGALTVLAVPSAVLLGFSAMSGVATVGEFARGGDSGYALGDTASGVVVGLAAVCAGLAVFGGLARDRDGLRGLSVPAARLSLVAAAVAVLVLGCAKLVPLPASVAVLAAAVVLVVAALRMLPTVVPAPGARLILLVAAHLALVAAVMVAWRETAAVPLAGAGTLVALAALASARPQRFRFLYVGAGFAYALVLVAIALGQGGVSGIAQLCLTASAGLGAAIVCTYLPRVGARSWQAVLVVATVPFGIGILQVVVERSGWTALSTGLMFALAMSLLLTRRPGLTLAVRTAAAAMLVPALAVVVVCLGAQLLTSSGSPVTLPIIAVLVALVLPSTPIVRAALVTRGHPIGTADAARIAIEASALLTGVIAVGLALWRDAAGLGTTFLVLLILGIGATAGAIFAGRRLLWWVAAASFTGALWCVWGMTGVDLLEAYLLPPTLGAAAVATVLTLRGRPATGLYAAGLALAIGPLLAIVAVVEPDAAGQVSLPWRVGGLLLAAWALLGLAALLGREGAGVRMRRLRRLRIPTLLTAGLASTVGTIQAIRIGLGQDVPTLHGAALLLSCLGVSALGAAVLLLAARGIRRAVPAESPVRSSCWLGAPSALALAAGTWFAIERDWFSIWAMWSLMLVWLLAVVVAASRARRGGTLLPPVWFLFAIAFVTAVVAWSPRDLRVEWFSLPLGAFLLLAGVLGGSSTPPSDGEGESSSRSRPTLNSWPGRWSGSWALFAPGIVVMMIASIVSTFTDPLTWRAILVMVLALAAILVGSRGRLAAPFLIGLIVLPIENVFVFSVQIGRGIESMPWWITLAVMGAVLLIIAVTAERRTGEGGSVAARIRDLR
ncbi:SCO7613 C-terminal domain-containing membrane protein [Microbacterium sp. NPDC057944]|uniref:SCO7613 C-terminal domain-containing membrane protein n=1 Tax=Microbacterium sp. NPDC057944 TaxID=3346286 RepID=UPI0036D7F50D